jgi:hypothetical protein
MLAFLPRSVQDFRRREHDVPINRFFYPQGGINTVGPLQSASFEMSSASMIGIIESCVAYAKQLCARVPWGHGNIIQRHDFLPVAGLKATSSGRSLKSRIFTDFTRKIATNGHFWGLAKMARPPKGARPSVNRGGFILKPKAYIANALNFFAL